MALHLHTHPHWLESDQTVPVLGIGPAAAGGAGCSSGALLVWAVKHRRSLSPPVSLRSVSGGVVVCLSNMLMGSRSLVVMTTPVVAALGLVTGSQSDSQASASLSALHALRCRRTISARNFAPLLSFTLGAE